MSLENITLDIDFVRSQFPAFKDPLCKNWAFFENAGGSYVPQTVINHLNNFDFKKINKDKYLINKLSFLCFKYDKIPIMDKTKKA